MSATSGLVLGVASRWVTLHLSWRASPVGIEASLMAGDEEWQPWTSTAGISLWPIRGRRDPRRGRCSEIHLLRA